MVKEGTIILDGDIFVVSYQGWGMSFTKDALVQIPNKIQDQLNELFNKER